jgi:hypothetical protein
MFSANKELLVTSEKKERREEENYRHEVSK